MPEDEARYRIKTTEGYYYSTGGGRYGRFDGKRIYAQIFFPRHAEEIITWMNNTVPQLKAQKEKFPGHAACYSCSLDPLEAKLDGI